MASRITLSSDDACLVYSILRSRVREMREDRAKHPGALANEWLTEVEAVYDRLTIKMFGREYLEREKARA